MRQPWAPDVRPSVRYCRLRLWCNVWEASGAQLNHARYLYSQYMAPMWLTSICLQQPMSEICSEILLEPVDKLTRPYQLSWDLLLCLFGYYLLVKLHRTYASRDEATSIRNQSIHRFQTKKPELTFINCSSHVSNCYFTLIAFMWSPYVSSEAQLRHKVDKVM